MTLSTLKFHEYLNNYTSESRISTALTFVSPIQIHLSVLLTVFPVAYYIYSRYLSSQRLEKPVKFELPLPDEAKPHWKGRRLNPPTIIDPNNPGKIQCYCPATGQFLGQYDCTSTKQMDQAIENSHKAQVQWKKTTFAQRRQVLKTLCQYILAHQQDLARVAARDTGKTAICAAMGEILVTCEKLTWLIRHGERILSPSKRPGPASPLLSFKAAEVRYEPIGVCGALVSWNYPFHNMMGPLIASIFAGNGVVVKCSEHVVWSSTYFMDLAKAALQACGHDPELVQLVYCWPSDANHFTSHPGLGHVTFIGSRPVARHVVKAAALPLTPVVVELGGKDPCVVLDDCRDIDAVASIILRGTFQSSGQNCIGIERVIATPNMYARLVEIFSQRVPQIRLGSDIDQSETIDMGAMITDTRFDSLEKIIASAVADGAKLVCGGTRYSHPNYPQGHYFSPTLLVDVTPDMKIAQDECFAPILCLMKARDTDDAVAIANSTEYGLGASVFGSRSAWPVADRLLAGNVAINDFATFYLCQLPFGGVKGSGYGKFGGEEGLRGVCVEKSVCYDKLSVFATRIPKGLDYPIPDTKKAWEFVEAMNFAAYGAGLWRRLRALKTLAGF